jgi:hypothetical protein
MLDNEQAQVDVSDQLAVLFPVIRCCRKSRINQRKSGFAALRCIGAYHIDSEI